LASCPHGESSSGQTIANPDSSAHQEEDLPPTSKHIYGLQGGGLCNDSKACLVAAKGQAPVPWTLQEKPQQRSTGDRQEATQLHAKSGTRQILKVVEGIALEEFAASSDIFLKV
jgi:hypothetical protein